VYPGREPRWLFSGRWPVDQSQAAERRAPFCTAGLPETPCNGSVVSPRLIPADQLRSMIREAWLVRAVNPVSAGLYGRRHFEPLNERRRGSLGMICFPFARGCWLGTGGSARGHPLAPSAPGRDAGAASNSTLAPAFGARKRTMQRAFDCRPRQAWRSRMGPRVAAWPLPRRDS
jgi:hypothetical protein